MKKIIISSLFLVFVAFPSVAPAQTFSVEQENQIKAVIQQITDLQIQLLLARIAELQTQIAELLAQQATQATQIQTVIQQTAPIFGAMTPVVPPPTQEQILVQQFSEKKATCSSTNINQWLDVFDATKIWFNAPERTAQEKGGYYDAYQWVMNRLEENYRYESKNLPTTPISSYCSWGNMASDEQRQAGCEEVLNTLTPFAQCVFGN